MTKYRIVSVCVLLLAATVAGLVLFTKKSEQVFNAPPGEVPLQAIKKAPDPQTLMATAPSASNAVAKAIADELIQANPKGPQPTGNQPGVTSIKGVDPKMIASGILADETKKITEQVLNPQINPADIKISSQATVRDYLESRDEILARAQVALKNYLNKTFDDASLQAMFSATEDAVAQLKNVEVPAELAPLQKEQLRLFAAQQRIFTNILDRATDPVAAAVSISLLPQLGNETQALNEKLLQFLKKS